MNIKAHLETIIEKYGVKHWTRAAQKDNAFMDAVANATTDIHDLTFPERVLAAVYGNPLCPSGNKRKYKSIVLDWGFCGPAGKCPCAAQSVSRKCKAIDHGARLTKTTATLLARYGTTNPGQTPNAKAAHTEFYNNPEKVRQATTKGRDTMLSRYGVDNAFKLDKIDREAIARRNWTTEACEIMDDPEKLSRFLTDKSIIGAANKLGVDPTSINRYIADYDIRIDFGSSYENEIATFLDQNGIIFSSRSRSIIPPRELDFYIPDYNLGIEFNGLYYHSCQVIDDTTHRIKMNMCQEAGVRLLMINEDEWLSSSDIIKRKILIMCQRGERGDGARKLSVSRIESDVASRFCSTFHIQGAPTGITDAFGAFNRYGELVAVITIGKQRGTGDVELSRFCTDGKLYSGVFTKIFKIVRAYFASPIVSFADLRYSDGGIYHTSGFTQVETIRPDYRYVKRLKTFHKSNFTRKKITDKFGIDMTNITEREAMRSLGYSRIYDCGKIKFVHYK